MMTSSKIWFFFLIFDDVIIENRGMKHPYLERENGNRLKRLFEHFPCLVLTGARQVGKSTLLSHLFPEIPMVVFDPVHDVQNARHDPELFLDNHPAPLILDEVQFVPALIPAIKRRVDKTKKPGQYILTGSQQWGVLNRITESLAGRAVIKHMEGFSLAEIAQTPSSWLARFLEDSENFDTQKRHLLPRTLYEQLWRGFLPETQFLPLDLIPDFHFSYQSTYIEKDIRLLAEITDLQTFNRFVRLLAALTAQEINYSQLGREIGITAQTAKRWLHLLIQCFEWFEVPAYSNNAIKKVSSKPKGYFADTGQVCFSQMISSKLALGAHPLWGSLFESAVVAELHKQALLLPSPPQFYHWRMHAGFECDLILERDGRFYPIEIKANSRPNAADARGIEAFRRHHPQLQVEKGLIIAPTEEAYAVKSDVWVIPWDLL